MRVTLTRNILFTQNNAVTVGPVVKLLIRNLFTAKRIFVPKNRRKLMRSVREKLQALELPFVIIHEGAGLYRLELVNL